MNIANIYELFTKEPVVSIDSRIITKGGLFFALKGESFNGNTFADKALQNGCSYAIIDEPEVWKDDRYIIVENSKKALQELATLHRHTLGIPVIGITGTNGKTTTKELVNAVLSKKYNTVCTKGNFNNHIGVPLTLLAIPKDAEIAIIEMGANHLLEIAELCAIADPDFGIITSIGKAHLEGFGSFKNIIKTKKELYDYVSIKDGVNFVNHDDELLRRISKDLNNIYYGKGDFVFCKGEYLSSNPFVSVVLYENNDKIIIESKLIGSYNTSNILAAACVGKKFGVNISLIKEALEQYIPDNNRSQLKKTGRNILLLDAYNANPSSMEASVSNFGVLQAEHKIVILGEMLELGEMSDAEHRILYKHVQSLAFERIFLVGKWDGKNDKNTFIFENTQTLIAYFQSHSIEGKTILIKGSRGNKLELIVPFL